VGKAPRPAAVRFYFDADVLGLTKVIAALRPDCTFPGDRGAILHRQERPACVISDPGALDTTWIPTIAAQGWLAVTRDAHVARRPAEIAAVRASGARLVTFSGKEATGTWAQLEILMTQWRAVESLYDLPGPFIYALTRTALRSIPL
jgi:PIN like domain